MTDERTRQMRSQLPPSPVKPSHMAAFGSIIYQFARHEYLMQSIMRVIAGARTEIDVVIMTSGLGYAGKRDALRSLLHTTKIFSEEQKGSNTRPPG
jgi:hypothetical protein